MLDFDQWMAEVAKIVVSHTGASFETVLKEIGWDEDEGEGFAQDYDDHKDPETIAEGMIYEWELSLD